jgi:flagellar basal-body rod protein FlgG
MSGAFEVGKVALRTQQSALEVMSNNIANASTPGFKRADVVYSEIVTNPDAPVTETEAMARQNTPIMGGVRMDVRDAVSARGELKQTGQMLDFAIDGSGMVELLGPEGQSYLWRGGRLTVNRDGYLAGPSDLPLRDLITIPDDATAVTIDRSGVVSAAVSDGEPVELGRITLVRVDGDASLERADAGLFKLRGDARTTEVSPGEEGSGTILQGSIEQSNVDFSEAMIELLMIQRAYAASAQIVQSADQLAAITNNLKR